MTRRYAAAMVLGLAGCASGPHVQRAPLALPLAESMTVEVRLTQHEIFVSHDVSNAGSAAGLQAASSPGVAAGGFRAGAAAGLIGALVDAAVNAHRSSVAEEAARPLHEHMSGIDIDALVYQSVDALSPASFAHALRVEHLDKAEADDEKEGRLEPGGPVLVLAPAYSVSYDGKSFVYVLKATVVDRVRGAGGKLTSSTRYHQLFEYVADDSDIAGGVSPAQLSADQWKALLEQASGETVAMLNYDIGSQPGDGLPQREYGRMRVLLDQDKGSRSWVRTNFSLLSVASASLKPHGNS
ncbi:MAG TPA: hypothetical protein VGC55_11780 [Dokdonella sp.]